MRRHSSSASCRDPLQATQVNQEVEAFNQLLAIRELLLLAGLAKHDMAMQVRARAAAQHSAEPCERACACRAHVAAARQELLPLCTSCDATQSHSPRCICQISWGTGLGYYVNSHFLLSCRSSVDSRSYRRTERKPAARR